MITVEEIRNQIASIQPHLNVKEHDGKIKICGKFILATQQGEPDPNGAESDFDIMIVVDKDYPNRQPEIYNMRDMIHLPKNLMDSHIYSNGSCCVCIWEHWLFENPDPSFELFLNEPVRQYFYGRHYYAIRDKWPHDEWGHESKGLEDAFMDIISSLNDDLPLDKNPEDVLYILNLLLKESLKGHHHCPCGSKKRLRNCHYDEFKKLHNKISVRVANLLKSLGDKIKQQRKIANSQRNTG